MPQKRAMFLRLVSELLEWTIQEVIPPFADSRRNHSGETPFEWVFEFLGWCGKLGARLTAAEVRSVVLSRIFGLDTDSALLLMDSFTRFFMIEGLLKPAQMGADNMAVWSEITDWIFAITGQSLPFSLCFLRLVRVELPEVCDDLGEPSGEAVEVTARTVG
jgi:hypothetical protein